jgi:predicted Ser/Thr protein kinase
MSRILYAKGKRGLIYADFYKGKKIAIKTKNPKSTTPGRIEIEAEFLL